jgi:hypothetical protein
MKPTERYENSSHSYRRKNFTFIRKIEFLIFVVCRKDKTSARQIVLSVVICRRGIPFTRQIVLVDVIRGRDNIVIRRMELLVVVGC